MTTRKFTLTVKQNIVGLVVYADMYTVISNPATSEQQARAEAFYALGKRLITRSRTMKQQKETTNE